MVLRLTTRHLRILVFTTLMALPAVVLAQATEKPTGPTSATDGDVKIHKHRKVFGLGARSVMRVKRNKKATEKHGENLPKTRKGEAPTKSREARIFKRHNHFAHKGSQRAKSRKKAKAEK
jgi:hypothetical protein